MKKFLMLMLTLLFALTLTLGVFGCKKDDSNSSSNSQVEEPEEELSLVTRPPVVQQMALNFSELTVEEALDSTQYVEQTADIALKGVVLGDLVKDLLGDTLIFDFYSDGNWYLGELGNENFAPFNSVVNALFNYEIISGKPLSLNEEELAKFGEKTVISILEGQFNFRIKNLFVQACPEEGYLKEIIPPMFDMTVNELCDLLNGEVTFFEEYLELCQGVFAPIADEEVYLIIDEVSIFLKNLLGNEDIVLDEIKALYGDVLIRDFFDATGDLDVDAVIESLASQLINVTALRKNADKINAIAKTFIHMLEAPLSVVRLDHLVPVRILIDDANLLLDVFFRDSETLNVFFTELKHLYGDTLLADIFAGIANFDFDEVIEMVENVLESAFEDNGELINAVSTLLVYMIDGTLGHFEIDSNLPAKEFINALRNVIDQFAQTENLDNLYNEWLNEVGDISFMDLLNENKNTSMEQLLTEMFDVFEFMLPRNAEKINAVEITFKSIFIGTLSAPGVKEELFASELLNAIADLGEALGLTASEVVFLRELAGMYEGVLIEDFEAFTSEIKLKDIYPLFNYLLV